MYKLYLYILEIELPKNVGKLNKIAGIENNIAFKSPLMLQRKIPPKDMAKKKNRDERKYLNHKNQIFVNARMGVKFI